jgi:hypothetical protein
MAFSVFSLVFFQQIRSVDVISRFPCVIALRVSSPFDQVLQGATVPKVSVIAYSFDFVFFLVFY